MTMTMAGGVGGGDPEPGTYIQVVKKKHNIQSITITNDAQNIFHGQDRNLIQNLHCFTSTRQALQPALFYLCVAVTDEEAIV